MTVKDLKQGNQVYMLHKEDRVSVTMGKVTSVSVPRIPNMQNGVFVPTQTQQLVMDVTIEDGGVTKTYTMPETLSVTYAGDRLMIALEREGVLREVDAMKTRAEDVIHSVDKSKTIIADCDKIMEEWNPVYKEKRENEARIGAIEGDMREMKTMMQNLLTKLGK